MRTRGTLAVLVVAVTALVALLAYGVIAKAPTDTIDSALAEGRRPPAPELRLPRLDGGEPARLADYRGKVVVLNFWASWCGPCREESPMLQDWHRRIEAFGGTVLGVDMLDVSSDARRFVREYGLTYPMLRDREADSARPFELFGYPETLVIDRRGRIAAALRGPVDEAFLRDEVEPLLREDA
jgi:cytochrome c biogenesis protein CcmG, thiol:disulfide interchange protein DsbE